MKIKANVVINNMPSDLDEKARYIVSRVFDGGLWFWGCFEDINKAMEAAQEINGVIVEYEAD
jgi:hypothetical protein